MAKKVNVEDVEPLIAEYNGNLAAIGRKLGVARSTVFNRVQESPDLQRQLKDARESMVDNAESSLYSKVLAGDITALIFFLKTQGKGRGYTERQEVRSENLNVDMSILSDEQLQRLANGEDLSSVIDSE